MCKYNWQHAVLLTTIICTRVLANDQPSTVATWDFTGSAQGWGDASSGEMQLQLEHHNGNLGGILLGDKPFIDSPLMDATIDDKHVVIVRLMLSAGTGHFRGSVVTSNSDDWETWKRSKRDGFPVASSQVRFSEEIIGNGEYKTYIIPLWKSVAGRVTRIRMQFHRLHSQQKMTHAQHRLRIEWIRIVKSPSILKVQGCINQYFDVFDDVKDEVVPRMGVASETIPFHRLGKLDGKGNMSVVMEPRNKDYNVTTTTFTDISDSSYAGTYNCKRSGGDRITITGKNFGAHIPTWKGEFPTITVGGKPCTDIETIVPDKEYACTLAPFSQSAGYGEYSSIQQVRVQNRDYFGVFHQLPLLEFAVPPPKMGALKVTNIASRSVDLVWQTPGESQWDKVTITGYVIQQMQVWQDELGLEVFGQWTNERVVTNVTTTTIVNLPANARFKFRIAALTEDQAYREPGSTGTELWKQGDLYGRRNLVPGALIGEFSNATEVIRTLQYDIHFPSFTAGSTHSIGPTCATNCTSVGLSRNENGEGHYGLSLVGSASIAGCSAVESCCDEYTENQVNKCASFGCTAAVNIDWGHSMHNVSSNPKWTLHRNGIAIGTISSLPDLEQTRVLANTFKQACGKSLRLTQAIADSAGAAWYPRQVNVREGFDTEFSFQISDQSLVCTEMDEVATRCRTRGGDGFAFVIQGEGSKALGGGGNQLGFEGINGVFAVEIDTFHSAGEMDPYENHISVMVGGTSHKHNEVASFASAESLGSGIHRVRVEYSPHISPDSLLGENVVLSELELLNMDERTGTVGMFKVYLDDLEKPVLSTLLCLEHVLPMTSGRAWVGFTSATGDAHYQVHDLIDWHFTSLRSVPNDGADVVQE